MTDNPINPGLLFIRAERSLRYSDSESTTVQCLKITEKVSFNIASEASYIYILSGHKLIKNAKKCSFYEFLKT